MWRVVVPSDTRMPPGRKTGRAVDRRRTPARLPRGDPAHVLQRPGEPCGTVDLDAHRLRRLVADRDVAYRALQGREARRHERRHDPEDRDARPRADVDASQRRVGRPTSCARIRATTPHRSSAGAARHAPHTGVRMPGAGGLVTTTHASASRPMMHAKMSTSITSRRSAAIPRRHSQGDQGVRSRPLLLAA